MKKKSNNKIFIFIIIAIIVFIVLYTIRKNKRKQDLTTSGASGLTRPGTTVLSVHSNQYSDLPNGSYPVARGQISKLVYLLQFALNKLHNTNLKLDGDFGSKTEAALQSSYNTNSVNKSLAKHIYQQMASLNQADLQISEMVNLMQNYL